LQRGKELKEYNGSGGYTVEIPWNKGLDRELTPAEVMAILTHGKKKKKNRKGGGGGGGGGGGR